MALPFALGWDRQLLVLWSVGAINRRGREEAVRASSAGGPPANSGFHFCGLLGQVWRQVLYEYEVFLAWFYVFMLSVLSYRNHGHADHWGSHICSPLFSVRAPRQLNRIKCSLFTKWCWDSWISACRKLSLTLTSHCTQKITENRLKA